MEAIKPVIARMRPELTQATMKEPRDLARDLVTDAQRSLRALHDLVLRAEREELRLRAHPRDVLHAERVAGILVRRLLLGLFAAVMAVVSSLIFVATHNWFILIGGNAAALFLFLVVLVIPKHLLDNPLRSARTPIRRQR
jgi:hypothetical protein